MDNRISAVECHDTYAAQEQIPTKRSDMREKGTYDAIQINSKPSSKQVISNRLTVVIVCGCPEYAATSKEMQHCKASRKYCGIGGVKVSLTLIWKKKDLIFSLIESSPKGPWMRQKRLLYIAPGF